MERISFNYPGALSAQHENLFHLQRILPGLETILIAVHGEWEEFLWEKEELESEFALENDDARSNHQREFRGKPAPEIIAIREVEIRYLNWSRSVEELPYDDNNDYREAFTDPSPGLDFSIWKQAVKTHMVELAPEEQGACFHDFCCLPEMEQVEHLTAIRDLARNDKEQDRYLRKFYGLLV